MPPASQSLGAAVHTAFADGGALATSIPGYEPRAGQQELAAAVAEVIENGGTLLAEAGTGTGKTLAYLIPAVLGGGRAIVSTGTKNLQEQILLKDVPALRQALRRPFTATLMKGRSNYLCLHRWEMYRDSVDGAASVQGRLVESGDRVLVPIIERWVKTTSTGDRAELEDLPEDLPLWKEVAADAETCLGTECPRHAECFVTQMRARAAESDIVIVNHHLLCADAAVRQGGFGEVIPGCPTLVVDEAHSLEDVVTQYFGYAFGTLRVERLVRDGWRVCSKPGNEDAAGADRPPAHDLPAAHEALAEVNERARVFFAHLESAFGPRHAGGERIRYTSEGMADHAGHGAELAEALDALATVLVSQSSQARPVAGEVTRDAEREGAIESLARRAGQLAADLRLLLRADDPSFVYFAERRSRALVLRAAPIDVSGVVRDEVLGSFRTVVLTSATLAVDGSFTYAKSRLGLTDPREVRVASEFDYGTQALLYLPRAMPHPRSPRYAEAAAREAIAILEASHGRAFVLFTSYVVLRTVQRLLEMALPYPILVQGSAPRSRLVNQFRRTPHAVLLGTSSFWQGVDVPGDALSCVIIDKLPFASPAEPVMAARIDAIRSAGGEPFSEFQVPLAILTLQQGLGRLIRHRGDRGVLAVLDPRLRTMGYGARFLDSLPPAPVTHDLAAVRRFFGNS